uniref:RAB3A interacting protein like 1 n=1 Tax=Bos indicus x Bos taurus TaxID=30522 RepID=A0A4W2HDK6_BOBOX
MAKGPGEREGVAGRPLRIRELKAWSHGRCLSKGGLATVLRGAGWSGVSWEHQRAARAAGCCQSGRAARAGLGRERARVLRIGRRRGGAGHVSSGHPLGHVTAEGRVAAGPGARAAQTHRQRAGLTGGGAARRAPGGVGGGRGRREELAGRSPRRRREPTPGGPPGAGMWSGQPHPDEGHPPPLEAVPVPWKSVGPCKSHRESLGGLPETPAGEEAQGEEGPAATQLDVSRLRSSSMEIREKGSEFLKEELHKAQKELKLKDEECERLSKVREQLEQELEELTASLFEEAHKMVREANMKQAASEKQLKEARGKVDTTLFAEFQAWRESPTLDKTSPFLERVYREDVGPCLDFTMQELSALVRAAVEDNTLTIEPVASQTLPAVKVAAVDCGHTNGFRAPIDTGCRGWSFGIPGLRLTKPSCPTGVSTCALSGLACACRHRIRLGDSESHYYISPSSRARITAVCNFFTYIRYIQQGLVRQDGERPLVADWDGARSGGAGWGGSAVAGANPSTLLPRGEDSGRGEGCELAKGSSERLLLRPVERGRAEGASWELLHQENQQEAPAYLDPAALSWAKTFPNPRGLNEQHPCYWPGFRDPTRWGLPCESAPRCVASKWWLNKGSPTSLCRPSPTLA